MDTDSFDLLVCLWHEPENMLPHCGPFSSFFIPFLFSFLFTHAERRALSAAEACARKRVDFMIRNCPWARKGHRSHGKQGSFFYVDDDSQAQ